MGSAPNPSVKLDALAASRGLRVERSEEPWMQGTLLALTVWRGAARVTGTTLGIWGRTATDVDRDRLSRTVGQLLTASQS